MHHLSNAHEDKKGYNVNRGYLKVCTYPYERSKNCIRLIIYADRIIKRRSTKDMQIY